MEERILESLDNIDSFTCNMYNLSDLYRGKDTSDKENRVLVTMLADGADASELFDYIDSLSDGECKDTVVVDVDEEEDVDDGFMSDFDIYSNGLNDCDGFDCDDKHTTYDIFDSVNDDVDDGIMLELGDDQCGEVCDAIIKLGVPEDTISQIKKSPVQYNDYDSVYIVYTKDGGKKYFGTYGEFDGEELSVTPIGELKPYMRSDFSDVDSVEDEITDYGFDEDSSSRRGLIDKYKNATIIDAVDISDDDELYGDFGESLCDAVKEFAVTADGCGMPTNSVRDVMGDCTWDAVCDKVTCDSKHAPKIALCILSNANGPVYNKYKGCVDPYINLKEAFANFNSSRKVIKESVELTKNDKEKIVNFLKDVLMKNGADSDCTIKVSTSQNKTITMTSGWHILQKDTVQKNELFKYLRSIGLKGIKSVNEYAQDTYKDPRFGTMHYMSTITAEYTDRFIENVVGKKMSGTTVVMSKTEKPKKNLMESLSGKEYANVSSFMGSDRCVMVESNGEGDCLGFTRATTIPNTDVEAFICNTDFGDIVVARKLLNGKLFLIFKDESDLDRYVSSISRKLNSEDVASYSDNIFGRYSVNTFNGNEIITIKSFNDLASAELFIEDGTVEKCLSSFEIRNLYVRDNLTGEHIDPTMQVLTEDAVQKENEYLNRKVSEIVDTIRGYSVDAVQDFVQKVVSQMYENDFTNSYLIIQRHASDVIDNDYTFDVMSEIYGEPVSNSDEFLDTFNLNDVEDSEYKRNVIYKLLTGLFNTDVLFDILYDIIVYMNENQKTVIYNYVREGSN